jgi:hypothetical protein
MTNPFRVIHRVFSDVTEVAIFQPGKVKPIERHQGPWTAAAALALIGTTAACHKDFAVIGLPGALLLAAGVVAVVLHWSRIDTEALQRSYVAAALVGVFGLLYQAAALWPARAALSFWLTAAWVIYLRHRTTEQRR